MSRNRLRILLGVVLVASLTAAGLTIALRAAGQNDPDLELFECTLWFTIVELFLLVAYTACLFRCERTFEDAEAKERCWRNCLTTWIIMQILAILGYLACLAAAAWG